MWKEGNGWPHLPPGPSGEKWALYQPRTWRSVMIRNSQSNKIVVPLTALAVVLTLACHQAQAQAKPFKITGTGVAPMGLPLPGQDPRPHSIVGNATHLGRHTGIGTVETDSAAFDPATGRIT